QQVGSLQAQIQQLQAQQAHQADPNAPLVTLGAAIESLVAAQREQQQAQQAHQSSVQVFLERLSRRATQASPRSHVPMPHSTKFTGPEGDLSFVEFKAQLKTAVSRFPEALATDKDKINFALQSMSGAPVLYFAPYVNGDVTDYN